MASIRLLTAKYRFCYFQHVSWIYEISRSSFRNKLQENRRFLRPDQDASLGMIVQGELAPSTFLPCFKDSVARNHLVPALKNRRKKPYYAVSWNSLARTKTRLNNDIGRCMGRYPLGDDVWLELAVQDVSAWRRNEDKDERGSGASTAAE